MIVQITLVRNELPLIRELLPVWKKYADGFVFMLDTNTDSTEEYLNEIREKYNILSIIKNEQLDDKLTVETDVRQKLFDEGLKYSHKIICLDADEYLDGPLTKQELEKILDNNIDTVFHLNWIQYTSLNTIRVDGPWKNNIKDRIGSYTGKPKFEKKQMHSTHLPIPKNKVGLDQLFVAHLQWLDKNYVAIKQYFWKVTDYINNKKYGIDVAGTSAYDQSVNNFNWEEEYFDFELKIREDIFEDISNSHNYRVDWIKKNVEKYNVPNLGDWGYNIHDSIEMYFCTAADEKHYPILINMIGSLHKHNYYDIVEIRIYDLGFNQQQINELKNIKKVKLCEIEKTNPQILEFIQTSETKMSRGAFSWKPVVIKDALDYQPYTLYIDAGTTILKPINNIFKHIIQNKHLLLDCGHSIKWMTTKYVIESQNLNSSENSWILEDSVFGIDAGFQGISKELYDDYVLPVYEMTKDINNFIDDKTCPDGYGSARQDQTLYSIQARKLGLHLNYHDDPTKECCFIINENKVPFHLTHNKLNIKESTLIFRSRWNLDYPSYKDYSNSLKRKYLVSVVTGIGPLNKYEKFIDSYFHNIRQQVNFNRIEFIIIYSEWSNKFDKYTSLSNIRFIQEDQKFGVYYAWNLGIVNATAEYVTNWNIDDLRFPLNNKIKYDTLSKNLGLDLAYSWYVGVTPDELETDIDIYSKPIQQYPDEYHNHTHIACMAGPDPLWRKTFHLFGGLFNFKEYSIIGDWEMWIRMSRMGLKFKLIPHILCIYVDHQDTVSKSSDNKVEEQKIKLAQQYKF
jgi:hypothetical protein